MITVYTTQTCAFCAMVKKYLTLNEIEFETVDVTDDEATRQMLFEKTQMQTVPVITNGTDYINGFNVAALKKLIANM